MEKNTEKQDDFDKIHKEHLRLSYYIREIMLEKELIMGSYSYSKKLIPWGKIVIKEYFCTCNYEGGHIRYFLN